MGDSRITAETIVIEKGDGLTQALQKLVEKKPNSIMSDGNISYSEWMKTIDTLVEINKKRKENGGKAIYGGKDDASSTNWKGRFLVHPNEKIEFTKAEMEKLYQAMGVTLNNVENEAESDNKTSVDTVQSPAAETASQKEAVAADITSAAEEVTVQKGPNKNFLYGAIAVIGVALLCLLAKGKFKGKGLKGLFKTPKTPAKNTPKNAPQNTPNNASSNVPSNASSNASTPPNSQPKSQPAVQPKVNDEVEDIRNTVRERAYKKGSAPTSRYLSSEESKQVEKYINETNDRMSLLALKTDLRGLHSGKGKLIQQIDKKLGINE